MINEFHNCYCLVKLETFFKYDKEKFCSTMRDLLKVVKLSSYFIYS